MIGGQVVDIEAENKSISSDELLYLHSLKTGAIIRSSGVIGAVMSNASDKEINAIDSFCYNLGIAFQIQDDLLDVLGNSELLGKNTGSDKENQKTTFITLFGVEKSKQAVNDYTQKAISSLGIFEGKENTLKELAHHLINRNY